MHRIKKLKPGLALLLAAAMALTGPAQSVSFVYAEEEMAEEAYSAEPQTGEADEAGQTVETALEEAQTVETALEETQTEGSTLAAAEESEALGSTQEQDAAPETTETEEVTETGTETETETEEEELKISGTEMNNAQPLSIGKKEITIKRDGLNPWYYFEPEEDGVYWVGLKDYEYECKFEISGVKKSLYYREWSGDYPAEELFIGKAGERVYFQPHFFSWYDDEEDNTENLETKAVLEVQAVQKGTVKKESDGSYTLSHSNRNFNLTINAFNTAISYRVRNQDWMDEEGYGLWAYCSGETYGKSHYNYIPGRYEYDLQNSFSGLDMRETYHMDYVFWMDDAYVWFGGTGEPFEFTTNSTDAVGGAITGITAGFASITVDYELFNMDTSGRGGWLRYKKDGADEWIYDTEIYENEHEEEYGNGNSKISYLDEDTRYLVELVSWDKKSVYDSKTITTGKYEGKVTVSVNQEAVTARSGGIDIAGYDADTVQLAVYFEALDDQGRTYVSSKSVSATDEELKTGKVTADFGDFKPDTEYQNVKIWISGNTRERGEYEWIYSGAISFRTKSASIKAEDISAVITPTALRRAQAQVEVKSSVLQDKVLWLRCECRRKGAGNASWYYAGEERITSRDNTAVFSLTNLEETDYEVRYTIDEVQWYTINGVSKIQEFHFQPVVPEGSAKANVKVKKTYVNGIEIEAVLTGVEADSTDVYTCFFEVDDGDGWWRSVEPMIMLDPKTSITKQIGNWLVYSGEKQRWRYCVCKNGDDYSIGYLDTDETQTIPMKLAIDSMEVVDANRIKASCIIENWSDVLRDEENSGTSMDVAVQIRRQGEEAWERLSDEFYFNFDKNGFATSTAYLYVDDRDIILVPNSQYEVQLVSYGDGSVVYAEGTFIATGAWDIPEENNFVYNNANTRRSIAISGNYEKPAVEVENDNIVSVREIRQSKIYLDIHSVGATKLTVTADGITKTITVTVSPSAELLFFLEGADKTLADIKLPDKFSWVNPSESPKADDADKIQYFDVTIAETDGVKYGKVPVAVTTLEADDIAIEGKETIGFGRDGVYSAYHTGTGYVENYYAEAQAYEITHEWTGDDGLAITTGGKDRNATVMGKTAGEHTLTLTITVKNFQTGNVLKREKTQSIKVLKEGVIDNLVISPAKEQPANVVPYFVTGSVVSGQVIEIDCDGYDLSKNNQLQLEAKTDKGTKNEAGETVLDDADVQWASASEEILGVDEKGLVTIKGKGEGKLNVAAKDEEGHSELVLFKIFDHSPIFEETEITVRCKDTKGTRLLYTEQDKQRVTGMALTGSDRLEAVNYRGERDWYIRTKTDYAEETTEQITLKITINEDKTYEQPLTVTILPEPETDFDVDDGTVAFSQTAIPNLFYVNSEAVFDVTDTFKDYEIEDIRTITKDKDAQNFHVKRYNVAEKTITFTANRLDANSVSAYAAKNSANAVANVEVKFKGFNGYYPKDGNGISVKVAVQNKPVSALKAEDAFVTGSINTACVAVLDKKAVFDLSGSSFEAVPAKTKAEHITAAVENGSLKLTQSGENAKGGKYVFNVTNPNWTKTLTLTGKISKVDVSKLTMKASKTKATLNTKYNDSVKIDISVKGNESLPVVLEPTVAPQTDALKVQVSGNHKSITLSTAEGKQLASGKYTISVAGKIGEEKTKVTKLVLTVTDKEPEVKLSAKGSINILNRDLSGITYTATIKNTDAQIQSAVLTGNSVLAFKVVKNDGSSLTLKALKTAKSIDTKTPYEIKLMLTLTNGAVIKDGKNVTLKVKPVDKLPKIKVDAPKKPVLSKSAKNGVAVKLDVEAGYQIDRIELDGKDKDKFDVQMNGQESFTISLAKNAGSIDSKAYSVKYKLYFAGANANTKQLTKSIKITVN